MNENLRLPRRIILSRKGWDSSAGGGPSPILEDGTLMSLPIPDCDSGICYDDLTFPDGSRGVGMMVEQLSGGRLSRSSEVHLDPDLRRASIGRSEFQAAFGQCGQSQFHLRKRGIETGDDADLFLFFGLYCPVSNHGSKWRYLDKKQALHVIFGWLQVSAIYGLPNDAVPPSLKNHPHARSSFIVRRELARFNKVSNTIYAAREYLTFDPDLPGAGLFGRFNIEDQTDPRWVTKPGQKQVSQWRLPAFFHGLSNMGDKFPDPLGTVWEPQRKGYGQEFVLDVEGKEEKIWEWLKTLFSKAEQKTLAMGNQA